jgi:hypothetical protein
MKKILLLALLIVSVIEVHARTFTIQNTTSYSVGYHIGGAITGTGPGCSTGILWSNVYTLSASSSVTYSNVSTVSWSGGSPVSDWYVFQGNDINYTMCGPSGAGAVICGATLYCSSFFPSSFFTSCSYGGVTINYSWTEDASGNVTCTFY